LLLQGTWDSVRHDSNMCIRLFRRPRRKPFLFRAETGGWSAGGGVSRQKLFARIGTCVAIGRQHNSHRFGSRLVRSEHGLVRGPEGTVAGRTAFSRADFAAFLITRGQRYHPVAPRGRHRFLLRDFIRSAYSHSAGAIARVPADAFAVQCVVEVVKEACRFWITSHAHKPRTCNRLRRESPALPAKELTLEFLLPLCPAQGTGTRMERRGIRVCRGTGVRIHGAFLGGLLFGGSE